jgi:hypothetical protein
MENEYSYRRIQQCSHLIQYFPEEWARMIEHRRKEQKEIENISTEHLMKYINTAYHPERIIQSLLKNNEIWKDYSECIEIGGSLWAFLGSALDKHRITPTKQEE